MYKFDLKDARDGVHLATAERQFHDFAPLKENLFDHYFGLFAHCPK